MDPLAKFLSRRSASRSLEVLFLALGIVLVVAWVAARASGELERRLAIARFPVVVRTAQEPAAHAGRAEETPLGLHLQNGANQQLWSKSRKQAYAAAANAPATGENASTVRAILRIPRVGLEVPVYSQVNEINLNRGAGLIANTAAPGGNGNVGIAAHRDGYFRALKDVVPGDVLELQTPGRNRKFRISRTFVVPPTDVTPLAPTAVPSVTLVTCYPFYFVGPAPQRYIVRAVAKGSDL